MKKSFNIIVSSSLIFCSFLSIHAQGKTVSEQELTALINNANKKLSESNYRSISNSKSFKRSSDKTFNQFVTNVVEYISPDHRHTIYEFKSKEMNSRLETISIGQKKYVKRNSEDWKEIAASENEFGFGGQTGNIDGEVLIERKYKGSEILKNQNAELYEIATTRKYNLPNFKYVYTVTERLWFAKNGTFLKKESETREDNGKITYYDILEYEYNPKNLKIEAPIIKTQSKRNPE